MSEKGYDYTTKDSEGPILLKAAFYLFSFTTSDTVVFALSTLLLTGLSVGISAIFTVVWHYLPWQNSSGVDAANDLNQTFSVILGLLLTIYLERSVEKRRRVTVAHENKRETDKRALDKEAIPQPYTSLVFYVIFTYSSIIYPFQRLYTLECNEPGCEPATGIILFDVGVIALLNFAVFAIAFSLQFKAKETKDEASVSQRAGSEAIAVFKANRIKIF